MTQMTQMTQGRWSFTREIQGTRIGPGAGWRSVTRLFESVGRSATFLSPSAIVNLETPVD